MSNWNPKPLRPEDPNPLFGMNEEFTVKGEPSPVEKQRIADGTPHTKGGPTRLRPGLVAQDDSGPELYLGKSVNSISDTDDEPEAHMDKSVDPDAVVKSFLSKGDAKIHYKDDHGEEVTFYHEEDEEEEAEKAATSAQNAGEKAGSAVTSAANVAGRAAGSVARTAVNLANTK